MIKCIEKLKGFGVFDDYSMPQGTEPFAEVNIIYGWNYSGKTTISRVFQCFESRAIPADFESASFAVTLEDNSTFCEQELETCPLDVKVFNSDFVESNLRWDGESFDPILLLGDESIEAQKELKKNEVYLDRCRAGYAQKKNSIAKIEQDIREAKSKKASQIKQNLSLVAAYTAAHLNQQLQAVKADPESYLLSDDAVKPLLKKALASDSDKLSHIAPISVTSALDEVQIDLADLLSHKPALTNTIEHLTKNSDVADWVKTGLVLHDGKESCEFCGNDLEYSRLQELKSHFSKDLIDHGERLKATLTKVQNATIVYVPKHEKDFHEVLRVDVGQIQSEISEAVNDHNKQLAIISAALEKKIKSQFDDVDYPKVDDSVGIKLTELISKITKLVDQNNTITKNFDAEKGSAISELKNHYVAEFCIEQELSRCEGKIAILEGHKERFEEMGLELNARNLMLEATISQAQKGREELNFFINRFLLDSNIQIDVVKVNDQDRFMLTRSGKPAKCLSEGEKTAIAFAFFLTKLKEVNELKEVIVCIDDPVSSLDSNHLFQLNAVIQSFFYEQDPALGSKWVLTIKQLFVSTHNFEFLGLLKSLPIDHKNRRKFFFVKRMSDRSATFANMPESIRLYSSEYQYLWSVIHDFHLSEHKDDIAVLLALPNAVRRFVELYTYSKIPGPTLATVNVRAKMLFGEEKSIRILKVLHHFSHSNNIQGLAQNSDLICDIENVVTDLVDHVKGDKMHYEALMKSIS